MKSYLIIPENFDVTHSKIVNEPDLDRAVAHVPTSHKTWNIFEINLTATVVLRSEKLVKEYRDGQILPR